MPVQLSATGCPAFLFPPLARPKRGPKGTLGSHRVLNLLCWVRSPAMQWKGGPLAHHAHGQPAIHSTPSASALAQGADAGAGGPREWGASRGRPAPRPQRGAWRWDHPWGENRGDGLGASGYKPQQGGPGITGPDHNGDGLSPRPVAPVHETAMVLVPQGLHALQQGTTQVGVERRGASRNRDGGVASTRHRQGLCHAGMRPNITEHPRTRKHPKRGRNRFFSAAIHAWRARVERTLAGEDQCKRLLLRFAPRQQRHWGMQLRASPLIPLRAFCGV